MPNDDVSLRFVRPADLFVAQVTFTNAAVSADGSVVQRIDATQPALVTFEFPAQHVSERAYLESGEPGGSNEAIDAPPVPSASSGPSRLVFELPGDTPFTIADLLAWSGFTPRLAANALPEGATSGPAAATPASDETAIEFPTQLLLSPDPNGRWVHHATPHTAGGWTAVWHTALEAADETRTTRLRAVGPTLAHPPGEPYDLADPKSSFVSALTTRDLAEIVLQSGDFQALANGLAPDGYAPQAIVANQFVLTPLGASVRMRGRFPLTDQQEETLRNRSQTVPSLRLYEHVAGLGRDQSVTVVREGFLATGHRAALVKTTRRNIVDDTEGQPATLIQEFRVVVQQPVLDYTSIADLYTNEGRELPFRAIRTVTMSTPPIDLPKLPGSPNELPLGTYELAAQADYPSDPQRSIQRDARAQVATAFSSPFWIQRGKADVLFTLVGTDRVGTPITFTLPMVFVPLEAVTAPNTPTSATQAIQNLVHPTGGPPAWSGEVGGARVALADEDGVPPGSTTVPVDEFTLSVVPLRADHIDDALAKYHYGLPCLPALASVKVRLDAIHHVTGSATSTNATLHDTFLVHGTDTQQNPAALFLAVEPVATALAATGGGGLAAPSFNLNAHSARRGTLASPFVTPVGPTTAQIASMLGTCNILGSLTLSDLVEAMAPDLNNIAVMPPVPTVVDGVAIDNGISIDHAPSVPGFTIRHLHTGGVEARLLWKATLQSHGPFVALPEPPPTAPSKSSLLLDARIVVPQDGPAKTYVTGVLTNFALSFADVAKLSFDELRYEALAGHKSVVSAKGLALSFEGALSFVNDLRSLIPSGGFGAGEGAPGIEVDANGIKAGFTIAVPTIAVGVFSLSNLSLHASLMVPFLSGPASFRFGISERDHPFMVTVSLFGGGGFFALEVSSAGVVRVEASIEFGAAIALDIGVASGSVSVTAGIYFSLEGDVATLTGFVKAIGSLEVLGLISITVEFLLSLTYRSSDGKAWGTATLTVSVEVMCFSTSVDLTVERQFAGSGNDPTFLECFDNSAWNDYCEAFA